MRKNKKEIKDENEINKILSDAIICMAAMVDIKNTIRSR